MTIRNCSFHSGTETIWGVSIFDESVGSYIGSISYTLPSLGRIVGLNLGLNPEHLMSGFGCKFRKLTHVVLSEQIK